MKNANGSVVKQRKYSPRGAIYILKVPRGSRQGFGAVYVVVVCFSTAPSSVLVVVVVVEDDEIGGATGTATAGTGTSFTSSL